MTTNSTLSTGEITTRGKDTPKLPLAAGTSLSDGEVLVRAQNISKKFCRSLRKSLWYGAKDIAHELNPFSRQLHDNGPFATYDYSSTLREQEFWAVNDVSFELRRGECLGLIGHNGAGKTTLLKMLNGLIKPDRGCIEIRGQVGALIALGAGFNPILTGRENIYVNASILGLTKHAIDEKLEDIIDFAEVGEFIDSPVQSYSSGMQVRLGFAVATALDPDVLLLDEVLAVGDAAFKSKSLVRIGNLLKRCAVVFVSHSESQVRRISTKGILLDRGRAATAGTIDQCFTAYHELKQRASVPQQIEGEHFPVSVISVQSPSACVDSNASWQISFEASSRTETSVDLIVFTLHFGGEYWAQSWQNCALTFDLNPQQVVARFSSLPLAKGTYGIAISIFGEGGRILKYHNECLCNVTVNGKACFNVRTQIDLQVECSRK